MSRQAALAGVHVSKFSEKLPFSATRLHRFLLRRHDSLFCKNGPMLLTCSSMLLFRPRRMYSAPRKPIRRVFVQPRALHPALTTEQSAFSLQVAFSSTNYAISFSLLSEYLLMSGVVVLQRLVSLSFALAPRCNWEFQVDISKHSRQGVQVHNLILFQINRCRSVKYCPLVLSGVSCLEILRLQDVPGSG